MKTDIRTDCEHWMNLIGPSDLQQLTDFARACLFRVGLGTDAAEDICQSAACAVMLGLRNASKGRHPRKTDVRGQEAFLKYLKGVILSLVEAERRRDRPGPPSAPLDEAALAEEQPDASEAIALKDLSQQLFWRLRQRVPRRLLPIVRDWAATWRDCDVIPLAGRHRRHRQELRRLAANTLLVITATPDDGTGSPQPSTTWQP